MQFKFDAVFSFIKWYIKDNRAYRLCPASKSVLRKAKKIPTGENLWGFKFFSD